jgi:membrane protein implicated in regulation of membrane protease activity
MEMLLGLGVWNWIIAGGLLLGLEVIAPGAFMLWLGLSALLVGAISLIFPWPWQAQLIAFAVFAVGSIPLWRYFAHRAEPAADRPFLNRRSEGFVGRIFILEKPIVGGVGMVRIDDTIWRVTGPDTPAGNRVRVTSADGANLLVEPAA